MMKDRVFDDENTLLIPYKSTEIRLYSQFSIGFPNQSEDGKYNLISFDLTRIKRLFLCIMMMEILVPIIRGGRGGGGTITIFDGGSFNHENFPSILPTLEIETYQEDSPFTP